MIERPLLRTIVELPALPKRFISYDSSLLLIGSCFSEHIGNDLKNHRFQVLQNPTGIMYNPLSILRTLALVENPEHFSSRPPFLHNNLWYHYDLHGSWAKESKEELEQTCIHELKIAHEHLHTSAEPVLIITFGSAWVYYERTSDLIVANCHKQPEALFTRTLVSVDDIVGQWRTYIQKITQTIPGIKILFTVSPIPHLRDGLHNNQLSKSTLLLAIHTLTKQFPKHCFYFPSYEIILDELRDYGFFTKDMCHISEQGIEYVNNLFIATTMDDTTQTIRKDIGVFHRLNSHRILHQSLQKEFDEQKHKHYQQLREKYPNVIQ